MGFLAHSWPKIVRSPYLTTASFLYLNLKSQSFVWMFQLLHPILIAFSLHLWCFLFALIVYLMTIWIEPRILVVAAALGIGIKELTIPA